jgi:hypothetical protein
VSKSAFDKLRGASGIVECPLSRPWLYLRSGVYYFRVRPKGKSKESVSVSLQTDDKQFAEITGKLLTSALTDFQRDHPGAKWGELAAHLKDTATMTIPRLAQGGYLDTSPSSYAAVLGELEAASMDRKGSHAKAMREAYDREGLDNPIGTFSCPHCLGDECDVEYAIPRFEFPSGASHTSGAERVDAGRCFQCDKVSYWRVLDSSDTHSTCDLPRKLLFPLEVEAASRIFCKAIADGIRDSPQALDNFIENMRSGVPLHEFAGRAKSRKSKR